MRRASFNVIIFVAGITGLIITKHFDETSSPTQYTILEALTSPLIGKRRALFLRLVEAHLDQATCGLD